MNNPGYDNKNGFDPRDAISGMSAASTAAAPTVEAPVAAARPVANLNRLLCRADQLFVASNEVIAMARTLALFPDLVNLDALRKAVAVFDRLNRGLSLGEGA